VILTFLDVGTYPRAGRAGHTLVEAFPSCPEVGVPDDRELQQAEVVAFALDVLGEMNYDVAGCTVDSVLGPAGIDLGSLAVVELSYRIEDAYGARFNEEDMERMATMTVGEFATEVLRRSRSAVS
jgi:acyl carrier protein